MRLRRFLVVFSVLCSLVGCSAAVQAQPDLAQARERYKAASKALEQKKMGDYARLRATLDDYPLALYLDYFELRKRTSTVSRSEAQAFLSKASDSPLGARFRSAYLSAAGTAGRWDDFLAIADEPPSGVELECYYYRAKLAAGERAEAWDGAARLWVYGKSRPKVCDPLFERWMDAGGLNDNLIWQRLLASFEARDASLMRYVGRKGSASLRPWADRLQQVYASPGRMRQVKLPSPSPYAGDIVSYGIAYLARYKPEQALDYWQRYQNELSFSEEQSRRAESAIARYSLYAESKANRGWLDGALARLQQDDLVEIRLRWALAEQDWGGMELALGALSDEGRAEDVWRYWAARIQELRGQSEAARNALAAVATERSYYGFLAANRLGTPYDLNARTIVLSAQQRAELLASPSVQRVTELLWDKQPANAYSEWYNLLTRSDTAQLEALAALAGEQNWYRLAIDAAGRAKAWDALELRFPLPFQQDFSRYASQRKVPATELMAIARRESAFYPNARSPVGARGLMQIMPATGKQVAKQLGVSHSDADLYNADHNIQLGSAYYRELLDRFGGNRVFALTGYNAGPHRVERWRHKPGDTVPVDIWVETIPFRETRGYVQAVLTYNVIFSRLRDDREVPLFTPAEIAGNY